MASLGTGAAGERRQAAVERKKRVSAFREQQASACGVCGRTALYRAYDLGGINRGACAEHKASLSFGAFVDTATIPLPPECHGEHRPREWVTKWRPPLAIGQAQ